MSKLNLIYTTIAAAVLASGKNDIFNAKERAEIENFKLKSGKL